MIKKLISASTVFIILITMLSTYAVAANNKTSEEAGQWAEKQVGTVGVMDSKGKATCAWFVRYRYATDFWGLSDSVFQGGSAKDYRLDGNYPSNWTAIPKTEANFKALPGDVAVWTSLGSGLGQTHGHVAVIIIASGNKITVAEQVTSTTKTNVYRSEYNINNSGFWGVIRPPYSNTPNETQTELPVIIPSYWDGRGKVTVNKTWYAVRDNVPVRQTPYDDGAIVGTLLTGEGITVTGNVVNSKNNLWYRVNYNGQLRWVFSERLTETNPNQISAVSGLRVESASADNNSARISWNSVSGANSYQIEYWSPAQNGWRVDGTTTNTSYTSSGLSAHPSWAFRVRARNTNTNTNGAWTEVTYVKPNQPQSTVQVPSAPSGLSATSASSDHNSARISWNAVSGATSYQVQYWSPANSDWRTDTSYSSGTSYTSTGLSANSSWTYRVRAVNSAGSSDWAQVTYTKPASVAVPSAPTGLSATSASTDNNSARISWNAVSGATSYQVQYWSPSHSDWRNDGDYYSGTSYTSTGLSANSSWTYRVRAVNSSGSSDWVQVTYTKPSVVAPVETSLNYDGYACSAIDRNMTVNVGAGSTLRFCNAPTSSNTSLGSISNNALVYVYGVTTSTYPNISGTYIYWAYIYYNGQTGWVNYAWLK